MFTCMKGRILYSCLFICLCFAGFTTDSVAQSITTNAMPQSTVCAGDNLSIPFSTTGTFASGNVFTAQLSDNNGSFAGAISTIGTLAFAPTSAVTVTIAATVPKTLGAGSLYKVRVISSNPARTSTNTQTLTIKGLPGTPGTSTPAPYCKGDAATPLVATASAGGTLNWYGADPLGSPASTATTPNTNLVGSTPYYVSQTVSGCTSDKATISVTVKDKPNAPGTSPRSFCLSEIASPLSASPVAGATLNWYTGPAGGLASPVAPTPSTSTAGPVSYYVSQTLNGCESARASLVVTVGGSLAAPVTTTPPAICQGTTATALSATASTGATLRWWGTNATGGNFSTTPTVATTQASATYYVSQISNNCESPRAAIVVTIKPSPALPAVSTPVTYCPNQTATALVATASAGGTLNWYGTSQTGGTASANPSTPITTSPGTTLYYVSQTVSGCEGARAVISVQVKQPTAAPGTSTATYCLNRTPGSLAATASAGGTLNWYGTSQTGGTASATAPTPPTNATGTTAYYVSQTVGGCESARASLNVVVNAIPGLPLVATPNPYCKGASTSPLSATGTSLLWYGINQAGGASSSTPTTPTASAAGTTNYYVTQTVNGCESDRAAIAVRVKDTPNAPSLSGGDFCQNYPATTLTVALVSTATVNWYGTSATGGTRSDNPPAIANTSAQTYTYYASQTLDGCEGPRGSVSVRVKVTPGAPTVSPISFCNNATAQPLTASGTGIKWYDASDRALTGTPTPATNNVGDQIYKATQTSGEGCESREKATLTVTIKPLPAAPGVANVSYCQATADQPAQNVVPITASGQNLKWYNPDGNQYPVAPTPPISQTGVINFQVTQTVNNCESTKATIQVAINALPAPAVAKPVVSYCINEKSVPLQATGESGSTLKWVDPYGRVFSDPPTPPTLNTNVAPGGDAFYVYQIGSNGCYSPRSTIKVIVNTSPTLALIGSVTDLNLGQKTPLTLKFTGKPPFSYTITGGYSGTATATDTTISILPRGNTTYQVVGVANSCGVGLPGNPATATVTVLVPTITTASLSTTGVCAGTSFAVPFTSTGTFTKGNVFRAELISVADTTKKLEVSTGDNGSPVTAGLPTTLAAGQYYVRVKASNPEVGIIGTTSPTVITVRSKPTAILTGSQTIGEGTPASLTVSFSGESPWTMTYADSVRSYSITTTTSPYVFEVRPARTATYQITNLTNVCGAGPVSGTATVTVLTVLAVEDHSLEPLVNVYPVPTGATLTVSIDAPLTHDPATLSLTNQRGQLIRQQTTHNRQTDLDLSNQPAGLYLLRVQIGDRQLIRKVLKQ